MTEEDMKELEAMAKHRHCCNECDLSYLVEAYELGEKAGRSEKKDSLSIKHFHEL